MSAGPAPTLARPAKHYRGLLSAYRPAAKIAVAGAVKPEFVEVAVVS